MVKRTNGLPQAGHVRYSQLPSKPVHQSKDNNHKHIKCKKPRKKLVKEAYDNGKILQNMKQLQSKRRATQPLKESSKTQDTKSQLDGELSDKFTLKPKLSASTRCARWLVGLPQKHKWSAGTTQSTITIEEAKNNHKKRAKRKKKLRVERTQSHATGSQIQSQPGTTQSRKLPNYLHVSAQQATKCSQRMNHKDKSRLNTNENQPKVCQVSKGRSCSKYTKPKCLFLRYCRYPNYCRQCLRRRWESTLDRTRPNNDYAYYKKHRTGYYITKKMYRRPTSLGWAILQVIRRLGRKRAYPLAILEVLKKKWGFPKLNLLELNNALRKMEQSKLLFCRIKMNRHYPKFQVDTKGKAVLCKRMRECPKKGIPCCNLQRRRPRLTFRSALPHGISVKTQWRERLRE